MKPKCERAVPGADPWTGPWKALDTSLSIDVLDEAAYSDADLVPTDNINYIFTSPLPGRLDLDWDFDEVGHPDLPKLDDFERELEAAQNAAALLAVGEGEDGAAPKGPGGFSRMQRDAMYPRSVVISDAHWQRTLKTRLDSGDLKNPQATDKAVENRFAELAQTTTP